MARRSAFWAGRNYVGTDSAVGLDLDDLAFFRQALTRDQLGHDKPAFTPPPQGTVFVIGE